MIDIGLRESQFSRVLGFLDEQLGDNDVTIVFGDASEGRVYFVSNRPLHGYQKHDGVYVKDAGRPVEWAIEEMKGVVDDVRCEPCYNPSEIRVTENIGCKKQITHENEMLKINRRNLIRIETPYAWNYSAGFRDLIVPGYQAEFLKFADDATTCHEAAHGVIRRHFDFLASYAAEPMIKERIERIESSERLNTDPNALRRDLLDEAVAQLISSTNYMDMYHADQAASLRETFAAYDTDSIHKNALDLAFNHPEVIEEIQRRIRERNLARKALIS